MDSGETLCLQGVLFGSAGTPPVPVGRGLRRAVVFVWAAVKDAGRMGTERT
jgi:hypothetical protein